MKIYLASDHAGFKLKEVLIPFIKELGHDVVDLGAFAYKANDDYPDYIKLAGKNVSEEADSRAIILGASGEGEAIVANKFPGIRAVTYYGGNREIIKYSRTDNDTNVLSLGARFLNETEAKEMVKMWLTIKFSEEERHKRRIEKVAKLEREIRKTRLRKFLRL